MMDSSAGDAWGWRLVREHLKIMKMASTDLAMLSVRKVLARGTDPIS